MYDEGAKSQLVALRLQPDTSVSRLARECGLNANQVARCLREHGHGGRRPKAAAAVVPALPAFVQVSPATSPIGVRSDNDVVAMIDVQARLPNGVTIDLRGVQWYNIGDVFDALGSLRCSASTTT